MLLERQQVICQHGLFSCVLDREDDIFSRRRTVKAQPYGWRLPVCYAGKSRRSGTLSLRGIKKRREPTPHTAALPAYRHALQCVRGVDSLNREKEAKAATQMRGVGCCSVSHQMKRLLTAFLKEVLALLCFVPR